MDSFVVSTEIEEKSMVLSEAQFRFQFLLEEVGQIFGPITHFVTTGFSLLYFIILVAVVVPLSIWILVKVSYWARNQEHTNS